VPVTVGQPAGDLGGQVQDVHVVAHGAQVAGAVGQVVQPVGDDRCRAAPRPRRIVLAGSGVQVDRRGERDGPAVRAPHRPAGAQRQRGELLGFAAAGRQQPDLRRAVGGSQERDPRAVRRPRRRRVGAAPGELLRLAVAGADPPEVAHGAVGVGIHRAQHVHGVASVRCDRRLFRHRQGEQIVDALASGHGVLLVLCCSGAWAAKWQAA
jgi:hypothetical protein